MQFVRLTIRQRLPLFISVSALLILIAQGYIIYRYSVNFYEQEFRERLQKRLQVADSMIARDPLHPQTVLAHLPPGELPDEMVGYLSESMQVVGPNNPQLLPYNLDTAQLDKRPYSFTHIGLRDYGIWHDSNTHHTLVVSAIDRYGQTKIQNLKTGIIGGIVFAVLLLTLASWFWVKKMLQPVANKINKARAIGTKSLNLRLDVKNNYDELGELAVTFNEMLDRLEQGFRAQQQFIRNASHEMRTPLTAITAEADLALQQLRTPEAYQHALRQVRAQAEHLNELVAQLLLMAKVDANRRLDDQLCAADEAVLLALRTVQSKYREASNRVKVQFEASETARFLVKCDPVILQTAYLNLIDNALKYGDDKPVLVRLFLQNNAVCLEVIDQGKGIESEEIEQVLKPFYRSKHTAHLPGSGIGLSLVKSIAEKYEGNIHLAAAPGGGVVARFCLPVASEM
jgi:signal transduction histidine kinase